MFFYTLIFLRNDITIKILFVSCLFIRLLIKTKDLWLLPEYLNY